MERRAHWTLLGLVAALGVAACGADAGAPGPTGDPAANQAPRESAPRARAVIESPDALPAAEVDRLLAAWIAAGDDDAARRGIEDRLVAGGARVLDRLIAWVGDPDDARRGLLNDLLPLFGDAAADRLLVVLRGSDRDARIAAMEILSSFFPPSAREGARGEAICRAMFACARTGDEEECLRSLYLMDALRPSARCIAPDLARLWCDSTGDVREAAARALQSLGTDAAPAAPTIAAWLRSTAAESEPSDEDLQSDRAALVEGTLDILASIGPADPSVLADLRAIAAGGDPGWQHRIAWLLSRWGDAAAPAAPELIGMLRSPDEDLRAFAARILANVPATHAAARGPLLEALTTPDASRRIEWSVFLSGFLRDPAFVARLAEIAPSLPAGSVREVCDALSRTGFIDRRALLTSLLARPEIEFRASALDLWAAGAADGDVPPAELRALLDDGDPDMRVAAAQRLAGRRGVDSAHVRDLMLAVLPERDGPGYTALEVLAGLAPSDAKAFDALVAALDDPETSLHALARIPPGDSPIPGRHPVAIAAALPRAFDRGYANDTALALLRLDGGADALVSAIQERLAAFDSKTGQERNAEIPDLMPVVRLLGPRAAVVRPALARIYRGLDPGPYEDDNRRDIDWAIAEIDGDLVALALTASVDRALVERFLAAGEAGREAIVLCAGRYSRTDDEFADLFHDVRIDDAIVAAAGARAGTDPYARQRHLGAATLAPLLPVDRACEVLRVLSRDDEVTVRVAAAEGWRRIAASHEDALTPPDVAPLLTDADWYVRSRAFRLAATLGSRGAALAPALRKIRDDRTDDYWLDAAIALWPITREPAETLPTLRDWMQRPSSRFSDDPIIVADDLVPAFIEIPFTVEDVPAIARALLDRRVDVEAIKPVLVRFGPAAAPAIAALRAALRDPPPGDIDMGERTIPSDWTDPGAAAAARVLVAIGPAARVAIPDLRARLADVGDRSGVLRDALRTLEASGK